MPSSCTLCDKEDTNQMVMCDDCSCWQHYKCAKVSAAIVDNPFSCKACVKKKQAERERIERERNEQAERERIERERNEQAERERSEKIERERNEQAERERLEKIERDRNEQAERERSEKIERERNEQAERERIERERNEQAERERIEKIERERNERAEREKSERERLLKLKMYDDQERTNHLLAVNKRIERERAEIQRAEQERKKRLVAIQQLEQANNEQLKLLQAGQKNLYEPSHINNISKPKSRSSMSSKSAKNSALLQLLEEKRKADCLYFAEKQKLIDEMSDSSAETSDAELEAHELHQQSTSEWAKNQQKYHSISFSSQPMMAKSHNRLPSTANTGIMSKRVNVTDGNPTRNLIPLLSTQSQREFLNSTAIPSSAIEHTSIGFKDSIKRIAATHLYDLPSFSGCPSEWPMFMSSYMRSTAALKLNNSDNLCRLQKCLKGEALKLVQSYLVYEESVPRAIDALRVRFGRPELILDQMIKHIRTLPKINSDKLETILDLSMAVQHLCLTMEATNMIEHLNNPMLLQELVEKLPGAYRIEWATYKYSIQHINLSTFDTWLHELAEKVSTIMSISSVPFVPKSDDKQANRKFDKPRSAFHGVHADTTDVKKQEKSGKNGGSANTSSSTVTKLNCFVCGSSSHEVSKCQQFLNKSTSDRWNVIKEHSLCRKCLNKHNWKSCRSRNVCDTNGCPYRHHKLLHDPIKHSQESRQQTQPSQPEPQNSHEIVGIHATPLTQLLFRVVPVILYGSNTRIKTFAFLDEGSSRTLIHDDLANKLKIEGPFEPIHLKWSNDTKPLKTRVAVYHLKFRMIVKIVKNITSPMCAQLQI